MYRVISKRNSFLERVISFEVDGIIKTVSAPSTNSTFESMLAQIESQYGEKATPQSDTPTADVVQQTTKSRKKKAAAPQTSQEGADAVIQ